MDDEFIDVLHTLFSEWEENGYTRLRNEDKDFDELVKRHAAESDRVMAIYKSLPMEDFKFLESFDTDTRNIAAKTTHNAYQQGMMDCVKLLKYLGVV